MSVSEKEAPRRADTSTRARWRQKRWILVALAAGLLLYAWGERRRPVPPRDGVELPGARSGVSPAASQNEVTPPANQASIRVGTFNIHGGRGADGVLDLERTGECLRGLDFIGLNEVRGPWLTRSDDQAQTLGEKIGTNWLFAPAEERFWGLRFGNGVLSRVPVIRWQVVPFPHRYARSPRNMVLLDVPLGETIIHVVVTHVDRSDDRERANQVRAAGGMFLSLAEPAILMGDMNSSIESEEIREILARPGVTDPLAEILENPPHRIDWIFARGMKVLDGGIRATGASDHPLIWAELTPKP